VVSFILISNFSYFIDQTIVSQGVSSELFKRRQSFTAFAEEGRRLSDGFVNVRSMHFKAQLCSLKERWNELFSKAVMSESTAEEGLKPLNEYQETFEEFTSRFEELEEKIESDLPKFKNSMEFSAQIEDDKVIVDEALMFKFSIFFDFRNPVYIYISVFCNLVEVICIRFIMCF
jgi:hypothetical protein